MNDIEKIKGIKISGKLFAQQTSLLFFNNNTRMSILFGRNGSGKSTIAHAIRNIQKGPSEDLLEANFIDSARKDLIISKADLEEIYIYDEEFIETNIRIDEDGLQSIIMLGKQVENAKELDAKELDISKASEQLSLANKSHEKASDPSNRECPDYHIQAGKIILKNPGGWQERKTDIDGKKHNITDSVWTEICSGKHTGTLHELNKEFHENLLSYSRVKDIASTIIVEPNIIDIAKYSETKILNLLKREIEHPELSEREKRIVELINNNRQTLVESAKTDFSNSNTKICPYCQQNITNEHRLSLLSSIAKVLGDAVAEFQEELRSCKLDNVAIEPESFDAIGIDITKPLIKSTKQVDALILAYNSEIDERINNIYTPKVLKQKGLEQKLGELNELLIILKNEIASFNKNVKNKNELRNKLINLNNQIAYLETQKEQKEYDRTSEKKNELAHTITKQKLNISTLLQSINDLKAKVANEHIAIEQINSSLQYIFYSKSRLYIEPQNNCYVLSVNGKHVRPKDVSTGERNVLALCYFFAKIFEERNIEDEFPTPCLLIIDDPISSFDRENKIGIHSFLRYKCAQIIEKNSQNRIVLMSHDLGTIFDFEKIAKEIKTENKGTGHQAGNCTIQLCNNEIITMPSNIGEYTMLLKRAYEYAVAGESRTNDDDLVIGNMLRRILEAYGTFEYKLGIEKLSCDETVLAKLSAEISPEKVKAYMYRLILHTESHFSETIYSLKDMNFFSVFEQSEKTDTARGIIAFLDILNHEHVMAHLARGAKGSERTQIESNLKQWGVRFLVQDKAPIKIPPK